MPFCSASTGEVPASDKRQDRQIAITGTIGIKSTVCCLVMFFIPFREYYSALAGVFGYDRVKSEEDLG
jgi:hypothetical protein